MKKFIFIALFLALTLSLTGCGQTDTAKLDSKVPVAPTTEKPNPIAANSVQPATGLTLSEVAKHNSATSCYLIVNSGVYDVTSYIDKHPGGPEKILGLCGQDATSAFTSQHGGQPRPETTLASFKIGELTK